jgi:LPXTG-motif cell wall-anchored protein
LPPSLTAPPQTGGNNATLLVVIGFVAVLLVGALLIYLFLFNFRQ